MRTVKTQILIIGSGAGGATTAFSLAENGLDVMVVEEGREHPSKKYGQCAPDAMRDLYRRRGMSPILGKSAIGYVEGCCWGGSTEINSGFWQRTPADVLNRWSEDVGLIDARAHNLESLFGWAERVLKVSCYSDSYPRSTELFRRGALRLGLDGKEIPRFAPQCHGDNKCAQGCPTGAKQSMSRTLLPAAQNLGARVLCGCRVTRLLRRKRRVVGAIARLTQNGITEQIRILAEHIFVCCGPTETPLLLRRSGITRNVGNSLKMHPMLKVAAHFDEEIHADRTVLPLIQVNERKRGITLGGAYFSPGHLAMLLSDNWPTLSDRMGHYRHLASYYVAVKSSGKGKVRGSLIDRKSSVVRYDITREDLQNLSVGLSRLSRLLLAAGARAVYPGVHGVPVISTEKEATRWKRVSLGRKAVSLTTVHAFASCPMGERPDRCATDSFGKVYGFENLRICDASILPDSPGVNPQGSIMAFSRRNALHFVDEVT